MPVDRSGPTVLGTAPQPACEQITGPLKIYLEPPRLSLPATNAPSCCSIPKAAPSRSFLDTRDRTIQALPRPRVECRIEALQMVICGGAIAAAAILTASRCRRKSVLGLQRAGADRMAPHLLVKCRFGNG